MANALALQVSVNGVAQSSAVAPRLLLAHYLRDELQLTGTHIGCDTSNCGACTCLVDGESVKSCTVLAIRCDGAEITTIEGMASAGGDHHPLQQAFWDNHGLQCGYCTPGMIMAAADLLERHEGAGPITEAEVRKGLEGNLCRCTGYQNIVKAVLAAAEATRAQVAA